MQIFSCHRALRAYLDTLPGRTAFVPTMGALHDGHLSLIDIAAHQAEHVIVSIFVNPLQFSPTEDFDSYPRDDARDIAMLKAKNVTALYLPSAEHMYENDPGIRIDAGRLGQELEGMFRPHFFGGVLTVVAKLFNRIRPDAAVFGEKDYQQLTMIRNMTHDLDMPVTIAGAPIIRDAGTTLALSSRNAYLDAKQQEAAAIFPQILHKTATQIDELRHSKEDATRETLRECIQSAKEILRSHACIESIDYIEIRNAENLQKPEDYRNEPLRLLAAVRIGGIRLLDNVVC